MIRNVFRRFPSSFTSAAKVFNFLLATLGEVLAVVGVGRISTNEKTTTGRHNKKAAVFSSLCRQTYRLVE
jgi:hypothetical protein